MTLLEAENSYFERKAVYTDYPIHSLGDLNGENAPKRKAFILNKPINKYVDLIIIDDNSWAFAEVEIGYIELEAMR